MLLLQCLNNLLLLAHDLFVPQALYMLIMETRHLESFFEALDFCHLLFQALVLLRDNGFVNFPLDPCIFFEFVEIFCQFLVKCDEVSDQCVETLFVLVNTFF